MIYAIKNSNLKKIDLNIKKVELDFFNNSIFNNDILLLDADIFDSFDSLIEYYNSLSKKLNVIAFVGKPILSEGALLIKKGFKSYIGKDTKEEIFLTALDSVKNGNVWLYPQLMNFIIKHVNLQNQETQSLEIFDKISQKEKEVAILVSEGFSNKEIADKLEVQLVTVKKHIGHIFTKLDVKDRLSLALLVNK